MKPRNLYLPALILGVFAIISSGLVAITYESTKEKIAANEREALMSKIDAMVPKNNYDNDPFTDTLQLSDPAFGSTQPITIFRARKEGAPIAAVLTPQAPEGYGGPIKLLIAIHYDGTLAGVRVLAHTETPGLGDAIQENKSDWIYGFENRSLENPQPQKWKVKKDGGVFDQFTGATITPRKIVEAVFKTLNYFQAHRDELFSPKQES